MVTDWPGYEPRNQPQRDSEWLPAHLETPKGPYQWQNWSFEWEPTEPGRRNRALRRHLRWGVNQSRRDATLDGPARLEHDLEGDNDRGDHEAGEDCQHKRPSSDSCHPCGQACPEREGKSLDPDHDSDAVLERHRRETEQE